MSRTPEGGKGEMPKGNAPEKLKRPEVNPDMEKYGEKARAFLREYAGIFRAIAGDPKLTFDVGEGFYIELREKRIVIDVKDFKMMAEQGLSKWQIVWSVCHELSHLFDLRESPKEMLAIFEYLEKRAKELAPKVTEILTRRFPEEFTSEWTTQVPIGEDGRTMSPVEQFVYKTLHRHVYNALDDMYVNMTLGNRQTVFNPVRGAQKGEVSRLYRDYLFPTDPGKQGQPPLPMQAADYEKKPKSFQLCDTLLRQRMVTDQKVLISPEVEEIYKTASDAVAAKMGLTFEREVNMITSPGEPLAKNPGWRYEQIKKVVEPVFVELFLRDLEEMPMPKPQMGNGEGGEGGGGGMSMPGKGGKKGKEGEGEGESEGGEKGKKGGKGGKEGKGAGDDVWEMGDLNPEPINLDTVRKFIDEKEKLDKEEAEGKKERDRHARLSPTERMREAKIREMEKMLEKRGLSGEAAEAYQAVVDSIEPYKESLGRVFEELIATIEQQVAKHWEAGFRSGKFDVNRFIQKYSPEVAANLLANIPWDRLDVYQRQEMESRLAITPNRFRVRLVVDGSGSMAGERIEAARQLAVLFTEALSTAEANINLTFKLKETFEFDTEIWMYGSDAARVKSFAAEKQSAGDELVDRMVGVARMQAIFGGTNDHAPLIGIAQSVTPEETQAIEDGKMVDLGFLITDGGSNDTEAARNALERVRKTGVTMRGLHISGQPESWEEKAFDAVWGDEGESVKHAKDIPAVVAKMLAEKIREIQMKVQDYELPVADE